MKYDSTHGRYPGTVEGKDGKLFVDGRPISTFAEKVFRDYPFIGRVP